MCGIDNAEEICETSEPAITSVQRDLEGEGFIAAKMLGLRISGSVSVSPLMPIRRDSTLGPKFTRKEDEYALCTPSGLILKGRVGGRYAFESVVADGLECGSFTFMVYHGDWQDIERVESAKWMPGRKALRISGVRNSGQKAFRVTCDIVPFAGKPWFGCNVVSVDNIGKENLDNVSVWLRQYAPWAKDAAFAGAVRQVPDLWKRPASGVWFRALDGAWCGAATFAKTVKTFNYYTAYDGSAHPDAEFGDSKMLNLAPGASWSPDGRVWMVAGAGFGGADGWEKFIEEFSGWWHKSGGKGKR